jgi:hypothetical protein
VPSFYFRNNISGHGTTTSSVSAPRQYQYLVAANTAASIAPSYRSLHVNTMNKQNTSVFIE